jgi:hypothetical protein
MNASAEQTTEEKEQRLEVVQSVHKNFQISPLYVKLVAANFSDRLTHALPTMSVLSELNNIIYDYVIRNYECYDPEQFAQKCAKRLQQRLASGEVIDDGEEMAGPNNNFHGVGPKYYVIKNMNNSEYYNIVNLILYFIAKAYKDNTSEDQGNEHIGYAMFLLPHIHYRFAECLFNVYCPYGLRTDADEAWFNHQIQYFEDKSYNTRFSNTSNLDLLRDVIDMV